MKNFLAPIMENKIISSIGKFCVDHKSSLVATGTISCSIATTAIVFKNSPRIHEIIWDTREALEAANNDEEKKAIYKSALKSLAPLVAPVIIFQTGTIATAIIAKKDSDKKDKIIADLTSAAAVAAQAIEEYKLFQKEAEKELGEKKLQKVRDNMSAAKPGVEITDHIELNDGEYIFRDAYSHHVFKGTKDLVRLAASRISDELYESIDSYAYLNGEYYQTLNIDDSSEFGNMFGYYAEYDRMTIVPRFSPIEVTINGTEMPGYDVYLDPSPEFIEK